MVCHIVNIVPQTTTTSTGVAQGEIKVRRININKSIQKEVLGKVVRQNGVTTVLMYVNSEEHVCEDVKLQGGDQL
jgi:hypothetical protein